MISSTDATVPVPCPIHKRHDLTPIQASRVITALNALAEEMAGDDDVRDAYDPDTYQCADYLDRLASDGEVYRDRVDALMESIGVYRVVLDEDGRDKGD